jgi:hypothetical protein
MEQLIVLAFVAALCGAGDPAEAERPESPRVDAAELVYAYQWNEALVDERYDGRVVEVCGPLLQITRSEGQDGEYVLLMGLGQNVGVAPGTYIRCAFPASARAKLAELTPQTQTICVRGTCIGLERSCRMTFRGSSFNADCIDLTNCDRVDVLPSQQPARSAPSHQYPYLDPASAIVR